MKILKTKIKDLKIIKSNIYNDNRGFLREIYKKKPGTMGLRAWFR